MEEELLNHRKEIIVGATPKLIASAKLSSSAPKRENAFSNLAERPSIRSKNAAIKMQITALSQSDSNAKRIPVKPVHNPIVVKILGNSLGIESLLTFLFDIVAPYF